MQAVHALARTRGLSLHEVRCSSPCGGAGAEEFVDYYQIVLPRRGIFIRHRGRRRTVADANHALFLGPGATYRVSHPHHGGDLCTVLSASAARVREIAAELECATDSHRLPDATPTSARLDLFHRRVIAAASKQESVEEELLELMARLLSRALQVEPRRPSAMGRATRMRQKELVENTCRLLASRLTKKLELACLARESGVSPFHLSRVFRRATGLTLHSYHERLRLRAALERLGRGPCDLTELALALGFTHHSHFTNRFRREFGVPPSAIRF